MKLRREDKVIVISGRDKGKTGTVMSVIPATSQVVVEGINIVKRHTKPSSKNPRGGILEITKPINASKVMAIDPVTGLAARIAYVAKADGTKERIYRVSPNRLDQTKAKKPAKKAETTATKPGKPAPSTKDASAKAGKKS